MRKFKPGIEPYSLAFQDGHKFNYFTAGYSLSGLDSSNVFFKQGVGMQWSNLDVCLDQLVNRKTGKVLENYNNFEHEFTKGEFRLRACANTAIVPHNVEGFFMNMGDMLVKSNKV